MYQDWLWKNVKAVRDLLSKSNEEGTLDLPDFQSNLVSDPR